MLQSHFVDPFCGSDALLVVVRKLFQDRMAAFAAVVRRLDQIDEDRAGGTDQLQRQADELRMEWQAIAQAVAATPAAHLAGWQAKAGILRCYSEHVGGAEGIEIDLARSLAADLGDSGGE